METLLNILFFFVLCSPHPLETSGVQEIPTRSQHSLDKPAKSSVHGIDAVHVHLPGPSCLGALSGSLFSAGRVRVGGSWYMAEGHWDTLVEQNRAQKGQPGPW